MHRRSDRGRPDHGDAGFTLIEILVAIVLVGILSAVAVIGVGALTGKANGSSCAASADAARAGSAAYVAKTGGQPTTLRAMVDAGVLQLATGLALDAAGTSIDGNGWKLTLATGTGGLPTFTCTETSGSGTSGTGTTSTTNVPGMPVIAWGPYLTAWVNHGSQLQLYVYDSGGASCPGSTDLFTETLAVQMGMSAFTSGDTISWHQLGGSSGTITPASPTPWTFSELDGSSPYWFDKMRGTTAAVFATDAAQDHFDLAVRATYSCDDQHGTVTQRVRTWHQTLVPGQFGGVLDGPMTG